MNGDPASSWTVNPDQLTSPQSLLTLLKEQDIRWVVKSSEYPDTLTTIAAECEKEGKFVPEAQTDVEVFAGNSRTFNNRIKVPIILMRVVD